VIGISKEISDRNKAINEKEKKKKKKKGKEEEREKGSLAYYY
jgi:hypothetical protein